MILWLNGAFGAGKTQCAYALHRRIPESFVFDPENVGILLRKNLPVSMHEADYQTHLFWRSFNREMLLDIAAKYEGTIIIPMTVTDRGIWNELTGSFDRDSFKSFILSASKETLLKRLASRFDGKNSWGVQQIDRCISAFEDPVFGCPIITDHLTIEQTAEAIAKQAGILLSPDNRGHLRRLFDRVSVQIHHIR